MQVGAGLLLDGDVLDDELLHAAVEVNGLRVSEEGLVVALVEGAVELLLHRRQAHLFAF